MKKKRKKLIYPIKGSLDDLFPGYKSDGSTFSEHILKEVASGKVAVRNVSGGMVVITIIDPGCAWVCHQEVFNQLLPSVVPDRMNWVGMLEAREKHLAQTPEGAKAVAEYQDLTGCQDLYAA